MENSIIRKIKAREILDSKGSPTVEVDLITDSGLFRAAVPSGVSTGEAEAVELRDGGTRYNGRGVTIAVANVNEIIAAKLEGESVVNQKQIDQLLNDLDATDNKRNLGANAILPVSLAVCRAGAKEHNLPLYRYLSQIAGTVARLPRPAILMLEGGLHAGTQLKLQEFMVAPAADSFKEALERGVLIYQALRNLVAKKYGEGSTNVGYEGALVPPLKKPEEALNLIMEASNKAQIFIDCAATTYFKDDNYYPEGKKMNRQALADYYLKLISKYPIIGIEDPFAENDFDGFKLLKDKLAGKATVIGDDLLITNVKRINQAKELSACDGLIVKPNQAGTVSETIAAGKLALQHGWQVYVKHRGGETNDDFIADLAVGLGAGWIMTGAPARGERIAKYNQLLRIEEELNQ